MSGPSSAWILAGVLVCGPLGAADLPQEPRSEGVRLLPGRLPWGPTALPSGEILAPCEDQSVTVLDPQARVVATWKAGARINAPVTVAPPGPLPLAAVPLITGRVDVVAWDKVTRTLAPIWAPAHAAESAATAWGASGTLYAAWKDGHLEAWSRGDRVWESDLGSPVSHLLIDEGLGLYAFGPGSVVLVDGRGRESARWTIGGTPRGVLQTMAGQLFCWTESGLWVQDPEAREFHLFEPATGLLGVTVDRQDRLVLTEPDRIRRFALDHSLMASLELSAPAVTEAVLDDRGRYLVGTRRGLEEWSYAGRFLAILDPAVPASAPLLTPEGTGAWSAADWTVHLWSGFRMPPFGWSQNGGGPGRPYSAHRPVSVAVRAVNWTDDGEFGYLYELAASGDEGRQRQALDRLAASPRPWANLIYLKVARSGLADLQMDGHRVANNWPANRLQAYTLLARAAGPEDREELIGLLQKEFDPAVAAQGFRALGRSGWDGDGRLLRLLAEVQARMPTQAVVADAAVDAARDLWQANGRSTDPVLVPLISAVFQGPFPKSVKVKAQQFFQDLMQSP